MTKNKILADLNALSETSDQSVKNKIVDAVDFIQKAKLDDHSSFPISNIHAKLLIVGDSKILYKLERGEYDN